MLDPIPEPWDFSLEPYAEVVMPLLDAVGARSVMEVGADRGDFTRQLLEWADGTGAAVTAVDPEPRQQLRELARQRPELSLVEEPSTTALDELETADVVILDGDHNYHTVAEELRLIAGKAGDPAAMPLLLVHDVGWPHARRDSYYRPDRIPEGERQPLAEDAMVAPGEPGIASEGILFKWAAAREGGERNGVLTAVEDLLEGSPGLRLAVIPAFFGLGVVWPEVAPWAGEVARIVGPWEASPMLDRLETLRIAHIVDRIRLSRQEEVLRAMLNSRLFAAALRIARLRGSRGPALSREQVLRAVGEGQPAAREAPRG